MLQLFKCWMQKVWAFNNKTPINEWPFMWQLKNISDIRRFNSSNSPAIGILLLSRHKSQLQELQQAGLPLDQEQEATCKTPELFDSKHDRQHTEYAWIKPHKVLCVGEKHIFVISIFLSKSVSSVILIDDLNKPVLLPFVIKTTSAQCNIKWRVKSTFKSK